MRDFWNGFEKRARMLRAYATDEGIVRLYHGTPEENNKTIDKEGLKPGKELNEFNNPQGTERSHAGKVHLTTCPVYAGIYGSFDRSGEWTGRGNIYQINLPIKQYHKMIKEKSPEASGALMQRGLGGPVYAEAFVSNKGIPKRYITKTTIEEGIAQVEKDLRDPSVKPV